MKITVLTLFPEMFEILKSSVIGRAINSGKVNLSVINIRDFAEDKHNHVDDYPYGGGAGMVIKPDVVYRAYQSIENKEKAKVIYLTPKGKTLKQSIAKNLSSEEHLILLCGHYEGIDERVIEEIVDIQISIGDYVLTGGELPAMVLIDTLVRLVPEVISKDSISDETFENNLLEYPQYTRPEIFLNKKVPEVLLSGHHENILKWRKEKQLEITKNNRPDLLK
jgi:tRNA (guanine37-N1)-methyltransferase